MKLTALICGCCLFCWTLTGCVMWDVLEFATPAGDPNEASIHRTYEQTELRSSNAADVLSIIHMPAYELLSQSKSVVAAQGQKKRGHKVWFNMVAFDENDMLARRKYLFINDARPKTLFVIPWTALTFDSEIVLQSEILTKPYSDENARRIAILKEFLESFRSDISEVEADNKKLYICGIMANQTIEAVLVKLESSPAQAARLSEPAGLKFDHISLDKGRIQMIIAGDIVTVKVRVGSVVKKIERSNDIDSY